MIQLPSNLFDIAFMSSNYDTAYRWVDSIAASCTPWWSGSKASPRDTTDTSWDKKFKLCRLQFFYNFWFKFAINHYSGVFLFQIRMKLSVFFSTRSRRVTLIENKKVQVFRERKLHKVSLLCVGHLAVGYRYDQRWLAQLVSLSIKVFFSSMLLVLSWETQKLSFHGYNKAINFTI